MYRITCLLPVAFALMAVGVIPDGRSIAHHGNDNGAMPCTTCHGDSFQGNTAIGAPALAGLSQVTIVARLVHYAGPTGHNAMMRQVATSLSMTERQAVAAYLSSLPRPNSIRDVAPPSRTSTIPRQRDKKMAVSL